MVRNLRATAHAEIQIRSTQTHVDVRVAENGERDALWNEVILAQAPWRQRYEKKAARIIPVAILLPSHPENDEPHAGVQDAADR